MHMPVLHWNVVALAPFFPLGFHKTIFEQFVRTATSEDPRKPEARQLSQLKL